MNNGFGERLKKLRTDANITQGQLGENIGVESAAVCKYENPPYSYPSVEVLLKISDYFHVSTDYLLKGTEDVSGVSNNINGNMSNSSFMQANHGGVIFNGKENRIVSPEATELLRVYQTLNGHNRLKLLNIAMDLENNATSRIIETSGEIAAYELELKKESVEDAAFSIVKNIIKEMGSDYIDTMYLQRTKNNVLINYRNRMVCSLIFNGGAVAKSIKFMGKTPETRKEEYIFDYRDLNEFKDEIIKQVEFIDRWVSKQL